MHGGREGLVPWGDVEARLESSRNYWIGTSAAGRQAARDAGVGRVANGAVVFGTDKNSRKARNIGRSNRRSWRIWKAATTW